MLYQKSASYQDFEKDNKTWIAQWKENLTRTPRGQLSLHTPKSVNQLENTTIVLARYGEDIDWIDYFPGAHFKVYNKGQSFDRDFGDNVAIQNLPNIAREGGTFVDFILQNYHQLPQQVLFSQADPTDHVPYYYDQIKAALDGELSLEQGYCPIGKLFVAPSWMRDEPIHGIYAMFYTLFAEPWDYDLYFPWGATMLVSKEAILARPIEFWQALKILINHQHGGPAAKQAKAPNAADATWGLEKCWPVVFDGGRTRDNFGTKDFEE